MGNEKLFAFGIGGGLTMMGPVPATLAAGLAGGSGGIFPPVFPQVVHFSFGLVGLPVPPPPSPWPVPPLP